jgi:hypothetical protein
MNRLLQKQGLASFGIVTGRGAYAARDSQAQHEREAATAVKGMRRVAAILFKEAP